MTICTFFLLFPKTRTGYQVPTFKFETQFFLFFFCVYFKKKLVNHLNVQKLKKKKKKKDKLANLFRKDFLLQFFFFFPLFLRKICEQSKEMDAFFERKRSKQM